ncbi:hypothetical protein [Salinisphaera sp.]|uniref:hypothetical protein n=1 Tax=Salinisphaera sp. TaxID=1914330 RepID=UPI002D791051|nr:hypothetical protein [Salinisphaera sp.]
MAVSFVPGVAGATMVSFTGTPDFMNLSPGASGIDRNSVLAGTITFSSTYHGGAFDAPDVTDIDLKIGRLDFSTLAVPGNARLTGTASDDSAVLDSLFYQLTLPRSNEACPGCSLNLALGQSPGSFSATYNTLNRGSGILTGRFDTDAPSAPDDDTAIPEPPGWLLLSLGLLLIGWGVRQRGLTAPPAHIERT